MGSLGAGYTDYYSYGVRYGITIPTAGLPDDSVITGADLYGYHADPSGGSQEYLGKVTMSLIDFTPLDSGAYSVTDYGNTTFSRTSSEVRITEGTAENTQVAYNLNALGLTKISPTGNTTFMLELNRTIDDTNFTWAVATQSSQKLKPIELSSGNYAPQLKVVYYQPSEQSLNIFPYTADNTKRVTQISPVAASTRDYGFYYSSKRRIRTCNVYYTGNRYPDSASGVNITPSVLSDGSGHTIPTSALDIKVVKAWYQSMSTTSTSEDIYTSTQRWNLFPGLLLNNDSLVRVDTTAQTNELWIKNATFEGYAKCSNSTDVIPTDATWNDTSTLQPFDIATGENKQIWITVHVPSDQAAGTYSGTIALTNTTGYSLGNVTLNVTVLPFPLHQSDLTYGIYYSGRLNYTGGIQYQDFYKTQSMMLIDLQKMYNHGIMYPIEGQVTGGDSLNASLYLRNITGFPKDKLYSYYDSGISRWGGSGWYYPVWDSTNLTLLSNRFGLLRANATKYGVDKVYYYALDEADATEISEGVLGYDTVHSAGGYVFGALNSESSYAAGLPYYDSINVAGSSGAGTFNATKAAEFEAAGVDLLSYANPQSGVENYSRYRENYGYRLYNAGYSGSMNFALSQTFGAHAWNDWDGVVSSNYRDHEFVYPTSTGGVDTVQFEGYREAIDDSRYAATLKHYTRGDVQTDSIISAGITAGNSSQSIREQIIAAINTKYSITWVCFTERNPSLHQARAL